jgi:hypothetical protein
MINSRPGGVKTSKKEGCADGSRRSVAEGKEEGVRDRRGEQDSRRNPIRCGGSGGGRRDLAPRAHRGWIEDAGGGAEDLTVRVGILRVMTVIALIALIAMSAVVMRGFGSSRDFARFD